MSVQLNAKKLILEAKAEVEECEAKAYKAELKTLYKRRMEAKRVLAGVEHEIELAEAKLSEILGSE